MFWKEPTWFIRLTKIAITQWNTAAAVRVSSNYRLSLGLWHNFGDTTQVENSRALLQHAFDLGISHFDLANNYGPPPGSAERNFGRILQEDFYRTGMN